VAGDQVVEGVGGHPDPLEVDPSAAKRHPLGVQETALSRALGQRSVGADDPVPRDRGIVTARQRTPRGPGCAGAEVAVGGDETGRNRSGAPQDLLARVGRL
jgi:hypothetical protein